jgi:macrolide-specific efflux system membrane fusion protein
MARTTLRSEAPAPAETPAGPTSSPAARKPEAKTGGPSRVVKTLRNPWVIGAAALMIGAVGWFGYSSMSEKPPAVAAATVMRADLEQTVLATGVLEPAKLVSVGAQASGRVEKLYVQLGDVVKAGDPIADIDSRTQQNTVSNAQAGLSNVQAQRTAAQAGLVQAQNNFARQQRLYSEGATSRADYETAESSLANAKASLAAVEAQIKQANLSLNTAETNLGYTRITAPMDGTVVAIVTEEGQTVNANQSAPTIIKLAQLETMTISAEISEADVDKVKAGQDVYFTTLGDTRTRHYATLRAIAPAPESIESETSSSSSSSTTAVYYNGLFDVDNADGRLLTGMTAQVHIVQASAEDALVIPSSALQGRPGQDGKRTVRVLAADGTVSERQVTVGLNTGVQAAVTEGLNEGEQVVVAESTAESRAAAQQRQAERSARSGGGGMMMGRP